MSEQELVTSIADRLKASGDAKVVFGEPRVIEGKTIVPVASVAYGFGGGSGGGPQGQGEAVAAAACASTRWACWRSPANARASCLS